MKKIFGLFFVLVMAISLMACGGSSSNVTREQLIGDWIVEKDDMVQYITLKEDGTYLSETVSSMGFTLSSEYRWSYENGVYTVDYTDMGVTSVYKKVTLEGDELTIDNGNGKIVYKRR